MKIVVCIKQVPATNDAKIDPVTKQILREGTKAMLNPFDLYAIEEALRIRERAGGEVIALSMGPPKASAVLTEALCLGADQAILLCDRAFGGSDTYATSYALARAIEKIADVDLVICGKQAVDGDTAQVGPGIAAHLGLMQAACVTKVETVTADRIEVRRMFENGSDVCRMEYPALITVVKDINSPRVPTLKRSLVARKMAVPVWTPADIMADLAKIGLNASPTRVVRTDSPPLRSAATLKLTGSPEECARALSKQLAALGLF